MIRRLIVSMIGILICASCSKKTTTTSGCQDSTTVTCPGPLEVEYCSTSRSYSNGKTITGTAQYVRREPHAGGLGNASTTGPEPAKIYPIRHAEVRVLDSAGAVAQCATTDATGGFSFQLPTSNKTYKIYVNSRSNNSKLVASVLDKPLSNQYYSLTKNVVPNADQSVGNLTASASGKTIAGAFNILDQLLFSNDYLRSTAGNCSAVNSGCTNFTVAPKVSAYWSPGFNPNSYFNAPSSGLSFYLPGYSRLFILGGINGDMDHSDTDHFDNSVIIHEYGHFLEDSMFQSDSPGGAHNGMRIIDPRLAWSEGWGNFFQAAVTNHPGYTDPAYNYVSCVSTPVAGCATKPAYIDTMGNEDGTTSIAFSVDLETPDSYDAIPVGAAADGEGNFREFAVSRFLWDVTDSTATNQNDDVGVDLVDNEFVQIWAALTKSSTSFKSSSMKFRNVGLLHMIHTKMAGSNTWLDLHTLNRHDPDQRNFAQYVSTGSTCTYTLDPVNNATGDTGAWSTSDLYYNNNVYHLRVTTAGTYTIRLDYRDVNGAGVIADLDLYLYKEDAVFGDASTVIKYSRNSPSPTSNSTANQVESVTATLAAGSYLINVNAYTGGAAGTEARYTLKLNGSQLCPATLIP